MLRPLCSALALTCVASLALWLAPAPAEADPGAGVHAHPSNGRFQLARYAPGDSLEVLDRVWGVLYIIDLGERQVAALDTLAGTIVTRPLELKEIKPPAPDAKPETPDTEPPGPPSWPRVRPLKPSETTPRFSHLQSSGVLRGGVSMIFDEDTGRLTIVSAQVIQVLDPVGAQLTSRPLRTSDGTGVLARLAARGLEGRVSAALLAIVAAEQSYRRQHPEARFGTLAELLATKALAAAVLEIPGYRFDLAHDNATSDPRFIARAVPTGAGRWLALTERGRVFVSAQEIPLDPAASMPPHAQPYELAPSAPATDGPR